ncbi:GNAT family N-acetyltransferase [Saccharomonospora xinjiangensis]|uniref:GNAT family N-acetyltransferase n=1 Tax=Saccharomonospora xinjiangensis TaxID=75294 RepID=UPI003510B2A9
MRRLRPLHTPRLLLRPFTDDDLPVVVGLQAARETHPHESTPPTPQEARAQFRSWLRHWSDHGFGYVAVELAATGRVIGVGGLQRADIDGETVLNLYYRFRPDAWGHGYASEMATAMVEWAARELPTTPVVIVTNVSNTAARRVAEKLSFAEYRRDLYRGSPAVYYRRNSQRSR